MRPVTQRDLCNIVREECRCLISVYDIKLCLYCIRRRDYVGGTSDRNSYAHWKTGFTLAENKKNIPLELTACSNLRSADAVSYRVSTQTVRKQIIEQRVVDRSMPASWLKHEKRKKWIGQRTKLPMCRDRLTERIFEIKKDRSRIVSGSENRSDQELKEEDRHNFRIKWRLRVSGRQSKNWKRRKCPTRMNRSKKLVSEWKGTVSK